VSLHQKMMSLHQMMSLHDVEDDVSTSSSETSSSDAKTLTHLKDIIF